MGSIRAPGAGSAEKAETGSGWYAALARGGLVAKGASFAIVAVLAIGVSVGTGGQTTSRQGALQALARHTWGEVVLALLAVGFGSYAIWRFVQALAEHEDEGGERGQRRSGGSAPGTSVAA